jgi:predicted nucleic-acid-binding protein
MKQSGAMIATDTNVLLRALVDDPGAPAQCQRARTALANAGRVFVAQIVQIELVWVLRRAYSFSPSQILMVLRTLANHAAIELQFRDAFENSINNYAAGIDFADSLLAFEAARHAAKLLTFDKKLAKHLSAELV